MIPLLPTTGPTDLGTRDRQVAAIANIAHRVLELTRAVWVETATETEPSN